MHKSTRAAEETVHLRSWEDGSSQSRTVCLRAILPSRFHGGANADADADNDSRPLPSGARSTGHFGEVVQWQYGDHGVRLPGERQGRQPAGLCRLFTCLLALVMVNGASMRVRLPPSPPKVHRLTPPDESGAQKDGTNRSDGHCKGFRRGLPARVVRQAGRDPHIFFSPDGYGGALCARTWRTVLAPLVHGSAATAYGWSGSIPEPSGEFPLCKPQASGGTAYEVNTRQTRFPAPSMRVCGARHLQRIICPRLPRYREPHRGCAGSYFNS